MTRSHSGFAQANNAQLYYEEAGAGQPLVLLHAGICDSRMWNEQVAAFAQQYRVIRYDLRGFGRSSMPPGPFAHHDDLRALLEQLHAEPAHLIGCSFGGRVASEFVLRYPAMAHSLVLVDAALQDMPFSELWQAWDERIDRAAEAGDFDQAVELELQLWVDGPGRPANAASHPVREQVRAMNRAIFARHAETSAGEPQPFGPPGVRDRLAEIAVPTLVLVGEHDLPDFHVRADAFAENISGAQKIVLLGAAHLPPMEQPEAFNQTVLRFLAGASHGATD